MATQDDVRKVAMALPGVTASNERFAFSVDHKGKAKGFAWVWMERIDPKGARVPQPKVLAVRVADQTEKAALLAADPDTFFTEPHYNGFPAVLVRLANVTAAELRQVITEAWRCMAPRPVVAAFDAGEPVAALASARPARRPAAPGRPAATTPGAPSRPKRPTTRPKRPTTRPKQPSRPRAARATPHRAR